jgi:hypothetical protein
VAAKDKEREGVQSELDDLLIVFGDLEEKVETYKERLRAHGENVSDEEDGDGDDDGGEDSDVD